MIKKIFIGLFSIAFVFSFSLNNVSAEPSEEEALEKAQSYADHGMMSKEELYDQLVAEEGEDYSNDLAQYAIDNVDADWKGNALEYANLLLEGPYTKDELEQELDLAKFTDNEIQYAMDNIDGSGSEEEGEGNDGNNDENNDSEDQEGNEDEDNSSENEPTQEEALEKAQSYADHQHMSKEGLYDQLVADSGEDYSNELAQYAVDNVEVDWKENALEFAIFLLDDGYAEKDLDRQLQLNKFTDEEIQYALDNLDVSGSEDEDEGEGNEDDESDNNESEDNDEGTNNENEENAEDDNHNDDNEQAESDDDQNGNESDEQEGTENDDQQQAEEPTEDNASGNDNEDESVAVESDDGSDNEEGGKLPDTATSTFNWLLVGGGALAAGGLGVFLTRKKKATAHK